MYNWTFEPGIELSGLIVGPIVDAFKLFPSVAVKGLLAHGIGALKGKDMVVDRQAWYPIEKWLAAFDAFATTVGPRALFQIGQQIPKYADPSQLAHVTDIAAGIASIDVGYHMQHRKNGRLMFDPATGQTLPGIGTYASKAEPGQRRITAVCEDPYPCEFDRGLLLGFATKFEKLARVAHDDRTPCRKDGARSCTYQISW